MPGRPPLVLVLTAALAGGCGRDPAGSSHGCDGLVAGDLALSEIMANPAGDDDGHEWFEIYNASGAERDLGGLLLAASHAAGGAEKTHVMASLIVPAGGYVVVGSAAAGDTSQAFLSYGYGKDLGPLANGGGWLALRCAGLEIDAVDYAPMSEGRSRGFSGALVPDYLGNDEPASWCDASVELVPGVLGSPGRANQSCGVVAPPGTCADGGRVRATRALAPGDLVVSEIMANPQLAPDTTGEWFEVYAARDVDLNGLEIGSVLGSPRSTIARPECVPVAAGSYLVFAHAREATQNGGLPRVDEDFGAPALANTNGALVLSLAGVLIDQVSWAGSVDGVAASLAPAALDAGANDQASAFCRAVDVYGAGDRGTPGGANPACPLVVPAGMCVDAGGVRAIVPAVPGQLLLTEVMADPVAVADASGEWFELLASADVDLNGLELGTRPPVVKTTLASPACLHVAAGTRLVLARSDDARANGGLPRVDFGFDFALANGGASAGLFVGVAGTLLDTLVWTSTTAGASTQRDGAGQMCPTPAGSTYGAGDRGTPGAENLACR
jgi:hypothetical protein